MSQLSIVNMALGHLGMQKISQAQLTADAIPSAVQANQFWEIGRDDVLGEGRWPFATVTQSLSAITTLDDVEWEYMYEYPTLAVSSIFCVFNEGTFEEKENQEFEVKYVPSEADRVIFSNLEDAIAEYTYKVTDTSLWSNKFILAFSYRLASLMCVPLSGDAQKALQLNEIARQMIEESKVLTNSEKRKKPNQVSSYLDARG